MLCDSDLRRTGLLMYVIERTVSEYDMTREKDQETRPKCTAVKSIAWEAITFVYL